MLYRYSFFACFISFFFLFHFVSVRFHWYLLNFSFLSVHKYCTRRRKRFDLLMGYIADHLSIFCFSNDKICNISSSSIFSFYCKMRWWCFTSLISSSLTSMKKWFKTGMIHDLWLHLSLIARMCKMMFFFLSKKKFQTFQITKKTIMYT